MKIVFSKCVDAIEFANKTKNFGIFYSEKNNIDSNMHVHECCEVMVCVSGGKTMFINDRIYDIDCNEIFVMNPFEAHKITINQDKIFKRYSIQIHPAFLYANSTPETDLSQCFYMRGENISHKICLLASDFKEMLSLLEKMNNQESFGDDILKNSYILQFLTLLNKHFMNRNKDYKYIPGDANKVIENSISYINKNFSGDLSLPIIAKNSFVSVNSLCKLFKIHLGTTVAKYVMSKRITEAKKMLKDGENVSATAQACGFQDYSNFIRTFKKTAGISPGKYATKSDKT